MAFFFKEKLTFTTSGGEAIFNDTSNLGDLTAELAFIDVLDGWTATAKPVVVSSQKAVGDGAYIASKFYNQGRVLTVEGVLGTSGPAETDSVWNQLVSIAFPLNQDIVVRHEGPVPRYVTARVITEMSPVQFMENGFRFTLDLLCPDPFKYDAVNVLTGTAGIVGTSLGGRVFPAVYPLVYGTTASGSANQVILNNIGTADTYPVTSITGPVDQGWRLENSTTGEFLSFDISIPSGSTLVIDHKLETALLDGSSVTGLINGDWWPLVPGVNTIKLFGNFYAASTFTVTARSAWR